MSEHKRIIVGVAGGIAAYKAATVVRQLTEAGHSVRVVPTESALRFVGAATFEALSGQPGAHRRLGRRPRGAARPHRPGGRPRRRRPGHRRPAGPRRRGPRRRSADRHAADRAMSGAVRARDAHRDVVSPGHRRQRRHAAPPRRDRPGAGVGPAHRRRQRRRPAARGRGDHHAGPAAAGPRRRAAVRPGRRARCWSPRAAPANRSTRCGSSATAVRASRATRWPG